MKEISESAIKKMLKKEYGLSNVKLFRLQGFFDQNYKVTAPGKKLFLKIYREDSKSIVKFQIDFIKKCQAAGLPVAKIIPTLEGGDQTLIADYPATLQEFLPGKKFNSLPKTLPLFKHAGSILGKIHQLTSQETFVGKTKKVVPWDLAQFNTVVSNYKKVESHLSPRLAALVLAVFKTWKLEKSELKKLKQGIIHGDYHAANILGIESKITAVTDFADANYSWYMADVAIALTHLVYWSKGVKPEPAVKAFLIGYTKYFPLPEQERKCLPLLVKMRSATVIVEGIRHYADSKKKWSKNWLKEPAQLIEDFS